MGKFCLNFSVILGKDGKQFYLKLLIIKVLQVMGMC